MLLGNLRYLTAAILMLWGDFAAASISLYSRKIAPPVIGIDVALIVDLSSSPDKPTPALSRLRTAQALLGRLATQDRAMVIGYAKKGIYYSDLLEVALPEQRDSLFNLLMDLPRDAPNPLLAKALEQTLTTFAKHPDKTRRRVVVLISEGRAESEDPVKSFAKIQAVTANMIPRLQKAGVRLYAVAHTENANIPWLKILTRENRGEIFQANDHQTRSRDFFQRILAENRFIVTKKRAEQWFDITQDYPDLVILATKQTPDALISLYPPNNEHWRQSNLPHQYRWITNEKYDLIALHHPEHGSWRIAYSTVLGDIQFITTMSLRHNVSTTLFPSGIDFQFDASLLDGQANPLPNELLEYFVVQVALKPLGGAVSQILAKRDPAAAQVYRTQLHLAPAGPMAMQIVAESPFTTLVDTMNLTISADLFPRTPTSPTPPATTVGHSGHDEHGTHDNGAAADTVSHDSPPAKTMEQQAAHKMLDALDWINERLTPVVDQAKQYAERELVPRAQEKSREALDWAEKQSKEAVEQGQHYFDENGSTQTPAEPASATGTLAAILGHPQAKLWGGSVAGMIVAWWLIRRMRRKKTEAEDDFLSEDSAAEIVDTADIKISATDNSTTLDSENPVPVVDEQRSEGADIPLDRPPETPTVDGLAQLEQAAAEKSAA